MKSTNDDLYKLGFRVSKRVQKAKKQGRVAPTTSAEREALREHVRRKAATPAGQKIRAQASGLTAAAGRAADEWTRSHSVNKPPDHMFIMRMYAREKKSAKADFAKFKSAVLRVLDAKQGN